MSRILNNKVMIVAIQILFVLSWYIYFRFFSPPSPLIPTWFEVYGIPIVISSIATLLFCIFSSNELRSIDFVRLSLPTVLVYLIVYAIVPSIDALIYDYSFEALGFTIIIFFVYDIPSAALLLFANICMGWLGSLLHAKFFNPLNNSGLTVVS